MNKYACVNCGSSAHQNRNNDIQSVKDEDTNRVRKTASLGTWRCSSCGSKVKVKRTKG